MEEYPGGSDFLFFFGGGAIKTPDISPKCVCLNFRLLSNGLMAKFNLKGKGKKDKVGFENSRCYAAVLSKTIQYFMFHFISVNLLIL